MIKINKSSEFITLTISEIVNYINVVVMVNVMSNLAVYKVIS